MRVSYKRAAVKDMEATRDYIAGRLKNPKAAKKLMTTLLLLENYQDQLDSISLTAPSYVYDLIWEQSTNASSADIRRGETQSLRNLLYAMLLPSGNEAAYIVADYMGGGSIDNFVAMMNDEAKAVGCTGTTFVDPVSLIHISEPTRPY